MVSGTLEAKIQFFSAEWYIEQQLVSLLQYLFPNELLVYEKKRYIPLIGIFSSSSCYNLLGKIHFPYGNNLYPTAKPGLSSVLRSASTSLRSVPTASPNFSTQKTVLTFFVYFFGTNR